MIHVHMVASATGSDKSNAILMLLMVTWEANGRCANRFVVIFGGLEPTIRHCVMRCALFYDNHNYDHKVIFVQQWRRSNRICTGPDCGIIFEVSANVTQVFFQMGNLVHNNLGGKKGLWWWSTRDEVCLRASTRSSSTSSTIRCGNVPLFHICQ